LEHGESVVQEKLTYREVDLVLLDIDVRESVLRGTRRCDSHVGTANEKMKKKIANLDDMDTRGPEHSLRPSNRIFRMLFHEHGSLHTCLYKMLDTCLTSQQK
jgi:hypothetical protein